MKFYLFKPDVSGSFGDNTVYLGDPKSRPLVISHLHYEFSLWPEDELQCTLSHYIGTERLRRALEALQPPVTGIEFAEVEISGDEDEFEYFWRKGRPDSALGKWYWFKITGWPGVDDFAVAPIGRLVVSERVLAEIDKYPLPYKRDFQPWQGEIEAGRVPQKGMPAGGES